MGEAVAKLDFVLSGCLRVAFYRSLHMLSVPFNVHDVHAYAKENEAGEGRFLGTVQKTHEGLLVSAYEWNGIHMGEGVFMDVRFTGLNGGTQTGIVRKHWYLGNFAPRATGRSGVMDGRQETQGLTA